MDAKEFLESKGFEIDYSIYIDRKFRCQDIGLLEQYANQSKLKELPSDEEIRDMAASLFTPTEDFSMSNRKMQFGMTWFIKGAKWLKSHLSANTTEGEGKFITMLKGSYLSKNGEIKQCPKYEDGKYYAPLDDILIV